MKSPAFREFLAAVRTIAELDETFHKEPEKSSILGMRRSLEIYEKSTIKMDFTSIWWELYHSLVATYNIGRQRLPPGAKMPRINHFHVDKDGVELCMEDDCCPCCGWAYTESEPTPCGCEIGLRWDPGDPTNGWPASEEQWCYTHEHGV